MRARIAELEAKLEAKLAQADIDDPNDPNDLNSDSPNHPNADEPVDPIDLNDSKQDKRMLDNNSAPLLHAVTQPTHTTKKRCV